MSELLAGSQGSPSCLSWNGELMLDGSLAEARAQWCVKNCGLSLQDAQARVMAEFPREFAGEVICSRVFGWDPEVVCGDHSAADRAKWCMDNCGLSLNDAKERVMAEFPADFARGSRWDPDVMCGDYSAGDRAKWCMENCGLSLADARNCVMAEFPAEFLAEFADAPQWDPEVMCGEYSAAARANWCVENAGPSHAAARQRIMREFPQEFIPVSPADAQLLLWSDEFDYTGPPDPAKWVYDIGGHGWGNGELQHYTDRPQNAWVANGTLQIRAVFEQYCGNDFTSARLVTKGRFDLLYGRVEVKLKLPTARGSWPAAWMLPTDSKYGQWPRSGEIDIMEHVGHDVGKVHGTVHTERFNHMRGTQVGRAVSVDIGEWHTYSVEWSEDGINFLVDDRRYHRFTKQQQGATCWEAWPFDHRFHLLLNVAVGGAWGGQQGVDQEAFEGHGQVLEVAWLRVYRLTP